MQYLKLKVQVAEMDEQQTSKEMLFDEFGEALIVLDAESNKVLLQNNIVEKFKLKKTVIGRSEKSQMASIMKQKLFASCPSDVFKECTADSRQTINTLKSCEDYRSVKQIVKHF